MRPALFVFVLLVAASTAPAFAAEPDTTSTAPPSLKRARLAAPT